MQASIDRKRIIQIGILAHDIEKSVKQWADIFGVETPPIITSEGYDKTGALYRGKPCDAVLHQAFFDFDNIQIEIIQPIDDTPSIWRECLDRDGEGLHHISFSVKNMAENVAAFGKKGMPILQKGEFKGGRYAYLDAMQGMKIILELLEND